MKTLTTSNEPSNQNHEWCSERNKLTNISLCKTNVLKSASRGARSLGLLHGSPSQLSLSETLCKEAPRFRVSINACIILLQFE